MEPAMPHEFGQDGAAAQYLAAPGSKEDFDIYTLKIASCRKRHVHDWSACPYAHPGERAARRDPRLFAYTGIACAAMKQSNHCERGDNCPFAHSPWEYWLHPTRYHTALCSKGPGCTRKICFFAHDPSQLRPTQRQPPACRAPGPEGIPLAGLDSSGGAGGVAPSEAGAASTQEGHVGSTPPVGPATPIARPDSCFALPSCLPLALPAGGGIGAAWQSSGSASSEGWDLAGSFGSASGAAETLGGAAAEAPLAAMAAAYAPSQTARPPALSAPFSPQADAGWLLSAALLPEAPPPMLASASPSSPGLCSLPDGEPDEPTVRPLSLPPPTASWASMQAAAPFLGPEAAVAGGEQGASSHLLLRAVAEQLALGRLGAQEGAAVINELLVTMPPGPSASPLAQPPSPPLQPQPLLALQLAQLSALQQTSLEPLVLPQPAGQLLQEQSAPYPSVAPAIGGALFW